MILYPSMLIHVAICVALISLPAVSAQCNDDPSFVDAQGFRCIDWVGYDCEDSTGTYTAAQINELIQACPVTCEACPSSIPTGAPITSDPTSNPTPTPTELGTTIVPTEPICADGSRRSCDSRVIAHVCVPDGTIYLNPCYAVCEGQIFYELCTPAPSSSPSTAAPTELVVQMTTVSPSAVPTTSAPTIALPTEVPTTLDPSTSCQLRGCGTVDFSASCQCSSDCKLVDVTVSPANLHFLACCPDYLAVCERESTAAPTEIPTSMPTPMPTTAAPTLATSCTNRCGESQDSTSTCSCDQLCTELLDCCTDYVSVCINATLPPTPSPCVPQSNQCHICSSTSVPDCAKCSDSFYLQNGECVDQCPAGFDGIGLGRYGRRCVPATPPGTCRSPAGHCHRCNSASSACIKCRDARYLSEGQCVDSCPQGQRGVGSRNYGRICVNETQLCVAKRESCAECSPDNATCVLCTDFAALQDGVCVQSCRPGMEIRPGFNPRSRFGRICEPENPIRYDCRVGYDSCALCDNGTVGDLCIQCTEMQYLYNGRCLESCPGGFDESGAGVFNRRCVPGTTVPRYTGPNIVCVGNQSAFGTPCSCTGGCHTCAITPETVPPQTCYSCEASKYLFRRRCVDEFECTVQIGGSISADMTACDEPGRACEERESFCHTCNVYSTACTRCRDGRYLFLGSCISSCPSGTRARGSGSYGRSCVPIA